MKEPVATLSVHMCVSLLEVHLVINRRMTVNRLETQSRLSNETINDRQTMELLLYRTWVWWNVNGACIAAYPTIDLIFGGHLTPEQLFFAYPNCLPVILLRCPLLSMLHISLYLLSLLSIPILLPIGMSIPCMSYPFSLPLSHIINGQGDGS